MEPQAMFFLVLLGIGYCQMVFDCPQLPPLTQPAKNVYELRPQDIKVIMAMGDSVTAGFGMMGPQGDFYDDLQEYRGQSWSIGLDSNASTVASFLRFYTPDIVGGSLGHHFSMRQTNHPARHIPTIISRVSKYYPSQDVFNAAQSGAMMTHLVSHEFSYLLEQLHENPKVDMENDWKLLSIFIGANDVCLGCSGQFPFLTVDDYQKHLNETLAEIHKNIPKVFVNLVLLGNISEIYRLSLKSSHCSEVHRLFPIECFCAFESGQEGDKLRKELDDLCQQYNDRIRTVAAYWAKQEKSDFAAVVQPFLSAANSVNFTIDFLSMLDCFHPSYIAHQHLAKALWNNMLTPAAKKKNYFDWKETLVCPTNTTLLYTN